MITYDLKRFGGYITNIEFNFQAGSEPSTASITIVSEDGSYIDPKLGESFQMPFDLGFSMNIMEYTYKTNGSSKTLSIELVDHSVRYLDMNLVLVRGEHTTGGEGTDPKLSVDKFWLYPMLELPEDAWPAYAKTLAINNNGSYLYANREATNLEGTKNVWILGGGRSIFTPTNQLIVPVVENNLLKFKIYDPEEEIEFFLVYEGGEFKIDKSETADETVYNKEELIKYNASDVSIEFGYTAKELKNLISNKLLIDIQDDEGYLDNELILFNSSGTIRECLSNVASKLGFFFYYKVTESSGIGNGQIVILGNEYINIVNNNINSIVAAAEASNSDAITLSSTKTLRGIEANHVTLKGEISNKERTRETGYSGLNNVGRSVRFKRIPIEKFFVKNNEYIERDALDDFYCLFLSSAPNEEQLFNDYVWAYYLTGNSIGKLYNEAHCALVEPVPWNPDDATTDPKKETDEDANKGNLPIARQLTASNTISYELSKKKEYDEKTGQLVDSKGKTSVIPPSESGLYGFLQLFYKLIFNLYISPAIPSYKAGQIAFSGGTLNVDDTPYNPNDKLKDVPALQEFVTLIEDYTPFGEKIKEKTISELAELAGQNQTITTGDAVGTRMFFVGTRNKGGVLGIRDKEDLEQDEKIGKEVDLRIQKNLLSLLADNNSVLLCHKNFEKNVVQYVKEKSEKLWADVRKKDVENAIKVFYTRNNGNDISFEFEFDESSIVRPNKYVLNNIIDQRVNSFLGDDVLKVEKASHIFISGPKKEVEQYYENIIQGNNGRSLVPYIEGPLVSADIEYFRAPTASDINPENGLDNFYISITDAGITTRIAFSSKKLFPLDQEVLIADNRTIKNTSSIPRGFRPSHRNLFKL